MSAIRVLVVGAGQRGQQWLRFSAQCEAIDLVGVADPDPTARNLARTYLPGPELRLFPRLDFALRAIEADAAVVCTPLPDHAEPTIACLEAGLAVLLEKPFATTMAAARTMVRVAGEHNVPLIIAQNYRYMTLERTLQNVVFSGAIGAPGYIECVSHRHRPAADTYQRHTDFAQIDMAIHHFDNWRALLGCNALWAQADAFNPPWSDYRHGSALHAHFEMQNGVRITYSGTLTSQTNAYYQRIEGSEGYVEVRDEEIRRGSTTTKPDRVPPTPGMDPPNCPPPLRGMRGLVDELAKATQAGSEALASAKDNLQTLGMAVAVMVSSREKRRVMVEEAMEEG